MRSFEEQRRETQIIIQALIICRRGNLDDETKNKIKKSLRELEEHMINTHADRFYSGDFHKRIIGLLKNDRRIKHYLWHYARRKTKKVPLEKELLVIDVIREKLNLKEEKEGEGK
jgi:hypothetical protein